MTTSGFLDDTDFNRVFWTYSKYWPGYYLGYLGPQSGQMLVFDATATYGAKRYDKYMPRWFRSPNVVPGSGCVLYADDHRAEPDFENPGTVQRSDDRWSFTRSTPPRWSIRVPIRVRAMVLASQGLFVAGPVDSSPANDPLATFEGRSETKLIAVSASEGTVLGQTKLESEPVFDGMAAASGRLYISRADGSVACLAGENTTDR
jgi:hypothetical protein